MAQQQDVINVGSENRPLMLYREGYIYWQSRILRLQTEKDLKDEDLIRYLSNKEAINILLFGSPDEVYKTVDASKSANKVWEKVRRQMVNLEVWKQDKKTIILWEFDWFTFIPGESLESYYIKYTTLLNKLARNEFEKRPIESNIKFLNYLQP
ncbi:hypothetical protein Tco_0016698 [Tanacetum coccineum]